MACGQTLRLLAASMMLAAAPLEARPACAPLRVMTYNIRLDLASDGPNRWSQRRDELTAQIVFAAPDLIGLQEVVPGQKRDLQRALAAYTFLGVARDDGRDKGEYSSLAIRTAGFRIGRSGTFWLSPTPARPSRGWDAAFPRIATFAHLTRRSDGRRYLVLNTHLDHEGVRARTEGARAIARFLAAERRPGEAIIVTGDFNTDPNSEPLAALAAPPLRLVDSRVAATSRLGPDGTFNNFELLPAGSRRIDYVLTDPTLSVRGNTTLAMLMPGGRVASDHFPVIADLEDCR